MPKQVTSITNLASRRSPNLPARLVTVALIFLITWGATVEVVHQHNRLRPKPITAQAVFDAGTVSQSQSLSQPGECLICQLHLNLFSGLLHVPQFLSPVTLSFIFVTTLALIHVSLSVTRRRGRAPPVFSLL
ncbi:MAG: hypothetical protein WCD76_02665 [Pyrinomonadaceae bacterium]